MGELLTGPNKKTLLVYGHLDVQPADKVGRIQHRV
jgi:acetylornithine deacetylase/succinyl-diaminopimelate desuccinylase-like protein